MTATLFQSGNDLSENYKNVCVRRMKTNSFDIYTLLHNPNIEIRISARRGPSEHVKDDLYVVGESYDSFDVIETNKEGLRWSSSHKASDLRSFDEAIKFAQVYNAQQNVAAGAF